MSDNEILSGEQIRALFLDGKEFTNSTLELFIRVAQAQRDHLKAQGWKSPEEVRQIMSDPDYYPVAINDAIEQAVTEERKRVGEWMNIHLDNPGRYTEVRFGPPPYAKVMERRGGFDPKDIDALREGRLPVDLQARKRK